MAATNFLAPAALFILTATMYTGRLNHPLPQDKVIDFGLNTTYVEQNPGPHYKYPCGSCTKPVKSNQRGVQCDICDIWYHTRCMLMSPEVYEGLANTSAVWICPSCGVPNFSGTLLNAENNMELSNPFSSLTQSEISANSSTFSHSDRPGVPYDSSSPKTNSAKSSRPVKKNNISVLNVNCQSLPAKR